MATKPLTPKQEAFCLAYMANGGNATDAYRASYNAAGMKDKTIWEKSSVLLADGKVAARIKELRDAAAAAAVLTEAQVLSEAARIGLSDIAELFEDTGRLKPIHNISPAARAAIASVEVEQRKERDGDTVEYYTVTKVKLWDKNAALEKLMKHLGMFERDNKQRAGIFDQLPKDEVERIVERLRAIGRPELAGPALAGSASRFTH